MICSVSQKAVVTSALDILVEAFGQISYSISFPEIAFPGAQSQRTSACHADALTLEILICHRSRDASEKVFEGRYRCTVS